MSQNRTCTSWSHSGWTVARWVCGVAITSSPGSRSSMRTASWRATVPLVTEIAWRLPTVSAKERSNPSRRLPVASGLVSWASSVSTAASAPAEMLPRFPQGTT